MQERQLAWNAFLDRAYARSRVTLADPNSFKARLELRQCGDLALVGGSITPIVMEREGLNHPDRCSLHVNLGQAVKIRHNGREIRLGANDIALIDDRLPYQLQALNGTRHLIVNLSRPALLRYFPAVDRMVGVAIPGALPMARFCQAYLANLNDIALTIEHDLELRLEANAHALVAALLMSVPNVGLRSPTYRLALLHRMKTTIQERLNEPDLSVRAIAQAFRITSRYVSKLFEQEGTTFTQYIRHQRLEECRRFLSMPSHANRQISEIAYSTGFRTQANFARQFRAAYNVSPRQYRARMLNERGGKPTSSPGEDKGPSE